MQSTAASFRLLPGPSVRPSLQDPSLWSACPQHPPAPCLSLILLFLLVYSNVRPFTIEIDRAQGWLFFSLHRDVCGDGSVGPVCHLLFCPHLSPNQALSQPLAISIFLQVKETGPLCGRRWLCFASQAHIFSGSSHCLSLCLGHLSQEGGTRRHPANSACSLSSFLQIWRDHSAHK